MKTIDEDYEENPWMDRKWWDLKIEDKIEKLKDKQDEIIKYIQQHETKTQS